MVGRLLLSFARQILVLATMDKVPLEQRVTRTMLKFVEVAIRVGVSTVFPARLTIQMPVVARMDLQPQGRIALLMALQFA
jgi:hypothetical protein